MPSRPAPKIIIERKPFPGMVRLPILSLIEQGAEAVRKLMFPLATIGLLVPLWLAPASPPAHAATPFDGNWASRSLPTPVKPATALISYVLRITDGNISYADPAFDVSGRVAPNGQVRVAVRSGQREAVGTGRLSRDGYGEGSWSGRSTSASCSGHWEAERRD